jgi:serine/threonine-protein kinase ATR
MAKVACAECLGMLGALDPSRVVVESFGKRTRFLDETALVTSLMKTHLVRLLRVAPSLQVLDATTFAIQVSRGPAVSLSFS